MEFKLTTAGKELLLLAAAGEIKISFRAIALGNGADAGDRAVSLSNQLMAVDIIRADVADGMASLVANLDNSGVADGFRCTELGILADAADGDTRVLYAYAYVDEGEADWIPAGGDRLLETQLEVLAYVGDASNVAAVISQSLIYVSKEEFDQFAARRNNPHEVTAAQVGLGNVPNVVTNDQTPTYEIPEAPQELESGERLGVALGKLARAVSALIAHLAVKGKNIHKETADSIGAAKKTHNHGAADINSGVLSLQRGGTGGGNAADARANLGAAPAIAYGTEDVIAGSASSHPDGTLYVVIE